MTREEYLMILVKTSRVKNISKSLQTALASKYPQGFFFAKPCKLCGKIFTPKAPSELYCCDYCKDYGHLNVYYKRNYGITIEEYLDMAEKQNFVCAICGKPNFAMNKTHSGLLVVDHNHATNKVRGLLCHNCNRAIGLLQDNVSNLRNAITYLEGATTIRKE